MEKGFRHVVEVSWSKSLKHFEFFFLDRFEYELLIMGSEEAHACFSSRRVPGLSLADWHDVVQVCTNVEPSHTGEPLGVENSHFKVNLVNFELFINELSSIWLFSYKLLSGRLDTKDAAFFELHWVLLLFVQLGALLLDKFLDLALVNSLQLSAFKARRTSKGWGSVRCVCGIIGLVSHHSSQFCMAKINALLLYHLRIVKWILLLAATKLHTLIDRLVAAESHRNIGNWSFAWIVSVCTVNCINHQVLLLLHCDRVFGAILGVLDSSNLRWHSLVHKVINGCYLVMTEVVTAQVTLHLFKIIDHVCDILLLEVLLRILWQNFRMEVIENLFSFHFRFWCLNSIWRLG